MPQHIRALFGSRGALWSEMLWDKGGRPMEDESQRWEIDELETLKALLGLYKKNYEALTNREGGPYATREELTYAIQQLINYLDRSLTQSERMADCLHSLTDSVCRLTDEVIYLKGRVDGDGTD